MPSFPNGGTITEAGLALRAKVEAGAELKLVNCLMGDGVAAQGTDLATLSALLNEQASWSVASVLALGDGVARARTNIKNTGLTTGFYAKECGITADDPDDGEILYAYAAADPGDWIPAEAEAFQQIFDMLIICGNASSISVSIDAGAADLTLADMEEHEAKQLDPTDTDAVRDRHLSNAQGKVLLDHTTNTSNPHGTTKTHVGLGNLPNAKSDSITLGSSDTLATSAAVKAENDALVAHVGNKSNPHAVTKAQVGLGNIPNAKSDSIALNSSVTLATSAAVKRENDALTAHINDKNNPHEIDQTVSLIGKRSTNGTWTLTGLDVGKPLIIGLYTTQDGEYAIAEYRVTSGSYIGHNNRSNGYCILKYSTSDNYSSSGSATLVPIAATVVMKVVFSTTNTWIYAYQ
jgi:hypothetical protein